MINQNKYKISVVIGTFNREEKLTHVLHALENQSFPKNNFEVIVVDDGSTDNTAKQIQKIKKETDLNLKYIYQENGRAAKARNTGIKNASGEIIAFTDDDCLPSHYWIEMINRYFDDYPEIVGIEGCVVTSNKNFLGTHSVQNTSGDLYITCNVAYVKEIIEKAGFFDEGFTLMHREDSDFALRVKKIGKIIFAPEVYVLHPPREISFFAELKKLKTRILMDLYFYKKTPKVFKENFGSPINTYIGIQTLVIYGSLALFVASIITWQYLGIFATIGLIYFFNANGRQAKGIRSILQNLIADTPVHLLSPILFLYYSIKTSMS
ncbi:glycosyltransferase family 2 protein [Patescibacteria group bacterium]|nr:glycosyltransferase family 2 protein [Patescibacteria group bacterium]